MIEISFNDRLGTKVKIQCEPDDTILDVKKIIAHQIGQKHEKLRIQKSNTVYKNHITLADYEVKDGMGFELFYD